MVSEGKMRPNLIILAGGKGSRLGGLVADTPKPMVDVHGKPFLYWLLLHYYNQGFRNPMISVGYKADVIINYPWSFPVRFVHDAISGGPDEIYRLGHHEWIVNGDTYIPQHLPDVEHSTIVHCHGTDAGAQYKGPGKMHLALTFDYFDIGTPIGLDCFREYFKSTYLYNDAVANGTIPGIVERVEHPHGKGGTYVVT